MNDTFSSHTKLLINSYLGNVIVKDILHRQ